MSRRVGPLAAVPAALAARGLPAGAGNAALAGAIAGRPRRAAVGSVAPWVVQRHSSFEHAMMGDSAPGQLGNATVTKGTRIHVLLGERDRMAFFAGDARRDPRSQYPDIRWVQFKGSKLWASYGELNALGDYLADPSKADGMTAEELIPTLQKMRSIIFNSITPLLGLNTSQEFAGAATSLVPGAGGEVLALDAASKGGDRYKALVARNACHMAPMSWDRWLHFHGLAREHALAHFTEFGATAPAANVDTTVDEHQRQAILNNGYADHFLEDSFASGHLINKTLVMQFFVDYINDVRAHTTLSNIAMRVALAGSGMPSDAVVGAMGSAEQKGMAGREHYAKKPGSTGTATEDRESGKDTTDPETAQERDTEEGRIAGSGVTAGGGRTREENYQIYLDFLNSAVLQAGTGNLHDFLNEHGLKVRNGAGTEFAIGGDDSFLDKSDPVGAETAGRAAEMSRTAIQELLSTGTTSNTVDRIFELTPQRVIWPGSEETTPGDYPLAEFQDAVLRPLCFEKIFPSTVLSIATTAIARIAPNMAGSDISQDKR